MDPSVDEQGRCICQLCNRSFEQITPSHLTKSHNISIEAYRVRFPDAALTSVSFRAKQRYSHTNVFKSRPLVEEHEDQVSLEELDDDPVKFTAVEELEIDGEFKKPDQPIEEQLDLQVPRGKEEILSYLRMMYPTIQDNYIIDRRGQSGILIYHVITDIADPVKKIDFEFPNTFWHNSRSIDEVRDLKLERDGWKILSFDSIAPTLEEIQEKIETVLT